MKLHTLKPAKGAVKKRKRIARGIGSGHGQTATRGHKGAKSRSGYKQRRGFEGGQMPIQMRLPKVGFSNPTRQSYTPINVDRLAEIAKKYNITTIDPAALVEHKIVRKKDRVKILASGELSDKLEVKAHAFSASAKQAIEAAGGTATVIE